MPCQFPGQMGKGSGGERRNMDPIFGKKVSTWLSFGLRI